MKEAKAMGEVIGMEAMKEIMGPVTKALIAVPRVDFPTEPYTGVYRLGDGQGYVSAGDWEAFWSAYPEWYCKAWMVCDNGGPDDGIEDVSGLTLEELDEALDRSPLEFAYYTETDEEGYA